MIVGHYLNENWQEVPLPIYKLPDNYMIHCEKHGDTNAHSEYGDSEIAEMLAEQGYISCPGCLRDICGDSW